MKEFLKAITMGACGALAVFTSFSLHWPTWVLFIAWVSYYLFGKSLRSALYALIPITAGILMGVIIQIFGGIFSKYLGAIGFSLAVFLLITSLTYLSKIKWFSNIIAWFIGLIIFFGVHPHIEPKPILSLFIPIVAGISFAFINDTITSIISKEHKN
ncbi:DUF1097 domain-containing protein [Cellulophaga baltica]|uniref:DUF1097 domain-containing protein n=1 Tax=Cellulophaga TaxID=104264 RepID=UPI001C07D73C|nr:MULTISPECIES: DUF1097 domain-containing protein [Cellulophaga]MBU2998113.1 DUF1097 domain-containing protein [Cellulophaga baltica]MDO6769517.1 DUF1097 domain-containing protein [Cellulophaga sp. 1_MG-2023]